MNMPASAILEDALPPKEKDPGSFTIPCYINNICFEKSLADLGASVSVMPYSTFTNIGLCELTPTKLIIELVDRTIKRPKGIAENVLVGLREQMELDLEARLIGEALILNRSLDLTYRDYIKLNDLNKPLKFRRNQVEDLGPTIEDGEVIEKPIIEFSCMIVVENMDAYSDEGIGDVIVGKPFCREICVKAKRFDGMITIYNGNDDVTYQMERSHPRFKHLTNAHCNKMRPLLKISARDQLSGNSHPYQKFKSFYKGVLNLGTEYIRDEKIDDWLIRGHVSIHEME
ncbi:homeodomain-like protein [Tanacetum coccineum]